MPQGLQIFDESGNIRLDITDRLTRILGEVNTVAGVSGSINHPDLDKGTPWVIIIDNTERDTLEQSIENPLNVSFSGTTMSWSYTIFSPVQYYTSYTDNKTIIYGVY